MDYNRIFKKILTESRQREIIKNLKVFKKILNESKNTKLFESIIKETRLQEMIRLQEMAQLQIKWGIDYIIRLIKSGLKSIKEQFFYWLTGGGKEGVLFFDENSNKVSAEQWFAIILERVKNCKVDDIDIKHKEYTYMQITEYRKRIEIIEKQYPIIIKFARENGWSEGKFLTQKQKDELKKKIINELDLSSI